MDEAVGGDRGANRQAAHETVDALVRALRHQTRFCLSWDLPTVRLSCENGPLFRAAQPSTLPHVRSLVPAASALPRTIASSSARAPARTGAPLATALRCDRI